MIEGDIVAYDLNGYGVNEVVILKIIEVLDENIVVTPIDGAWSIPFQHWGIEEILSSEYVIEILHTIAPQTPPRDTE